MVHSKLSLADQGSLSWALSPPATTEMKCGNLNYTLTAFYENDFEL